MQQLGLVTRYRSDEEVKLFCGMLDGLAFLPVSEVPQGLQYLKALNLSLIILTQRMFLAPIAESSAQSVQMV